MNVIRVGLFASWFAFVGFFVLATVDFFTHYNPQSVGGYVKHHSYYWAGMAVTTLLILLLSKLPSRRHRE